MIISFKENQIDFKEFHSVSASDRSIVFHGLEHDKTIALDHIGQEHIESVCDLIADQYCQGKKELKLERYL